MTSEIQWSPCTVTLPDHNFTITLILESVSYFVPLTLVPLFFFSTFWSALSISFAASYSFSLLKTELSNLPFAVWQTQCLNNYHHVNKVTNAIYMNLGKLGKMMIDREAWHIAVHGVKKSQTWRGNFHFTKEEGYQLEKLPARTKWM